AGARLPPQPSVSESILGAMIMSPSTSSQLNPAFIPPKAAEVTAALAAHPLTTGQESEVLSFLAVRPVHTVVMAGFIRDNGLASPLNRGTFYGCRDEEG